MAARARSRFDRDDEVGPTSDVYTGLLALSLIAMIVSSLLLFLDYSDYKGAAPKVAIPTPKLKEGVPVGQLPPNLLLPPPAPISERPFTRGTETVARPPVKAVGGEEMQAPPTPAPVAEPPPIAVPAPTPPAQPEPKAPAPEPVAAPPAPAPEAPTAPSAPSPPPLPKSIRSLPNS